MSNTSIGASTSRTRLRGMLETTFGVIPVTGNPFNIRNTGNTLTFGLSKVESEEIRDDRQTGGTTTVDATSGGDVNFELSYGEYDPFLQALLGSTYSFYGTNGVGTTFTAAYTATTITATVAPTTTSAFTTLQLGQWFVNSHPGSLNNGKLLRVSPTVAPTATIITLDASTPATVEAATAGAALQTARLTNGVAENSFIIEEEFADTSKFMAHRGQVLDKMTLKLASGSLISGSFTFMGKDANDGTSVTALPGTPTASKTYPTQNAVKGVGTLWEGTAPMTTNFIESLDFTYNNQVYSQKAIGTLGNAGIAQNRIMAEATGKMYFKDWTTFLKFKNDVYTQLIIPIQDSTGNGCVITLPRCTYQDWKLEKTNNGTVYASFTLKAYADDANAIPAMRKTIFWDRVGVVPV
jgi:hypothetical protein